MEWNCTEGIWMEEKFMTAIVAIIIIWFCGFFMAQALDGAGFATVVSKPNWLKQVYHPTTADPNTGKKDTGRAYASGATWTNILTWVIISNWETTDTKK